MVTKIELTMRHPRASKRALAKRRKRGYDGPKLRLVPIPDSEYIDNTLFAGLLGTSNWEKPSIKFVKCTSSIKSGYRSPL